MDAEWLSAFLKMTEQPALIVSDGWIQELNPAASEMGLHKNSALADCMSPLPPSDPELSVQSFDAEVLSVPCRVRRTEQGEASLLVFTPAEALSSMEQSGNARALARASGSLRRCLQELNASLSILSDSLDLSDPGTADHASAALRCTYQLIRTAGHMEDYYLFASGNYRLDLRSCELNAALSRLCENAGGLLEYRGITLSATLPTQFCLCFADEKLLEHLFWELISNAAAGAADGKIELRAQVSDRKTLLLTVKNAMKKAALPQPPCTRYAMPPEEFAEEFGIGLGLTLAASAARLHGGTLLLSVDSDGYFTASASLSLEGKPGETLASSVLIPDFGQQSGLIALSTVLPISAYDPRDLKG